MYDVTIRGARIADGTGAPLFEGDVGIRDGRIVEIGRVASAGRMDVEAAGLVLAPGIVDVHTHYDAQLTWDRTASPSPALGVTTAVMGNCGFGIAPAPAHARGDIMRNLSEVEAMPLQALEAGIDWGFESFADYLDLLRAKRPYINVAAFVGHSAVRSIVMGREASERAASEDEVAAMRALVRDSLAAGAIGFASSQSQNHNGYGGVPMPSRLATDSELRTLCSAMGESGRGIFQMTVGPQTTVDLLEAIAAENGRPVCFSALLDNENFPERAPGMLEACSAARARGRAVYAQVACLPLSMDFTMENAYPMQSLEVYEALRGAAPKAIAQALADADFRRRFREQLAVPARGKLFYGEWHRVEVAAAKAAKNAALEGRSVAEIADARGCDPVDAFFDLALEEGLGTVFTARLLNANEDRVEPLLRHESSVIALSDAGAHLSLLCDAGYGLHLLGHWVRDRGAFRLEEAVRELTSRPADLYGIRGRGRIAIGACADLLLFDPATVGQGAKRRVHDLPAGASRLVRDPRGVHGVWVNGKQVYDGSALVDLDAGPGEVLDRFAA